MRLRKDEKFLRRGLLWARGGGGGGGGGGGKVVQDKRGNSGIVFGSSIASITNNTTAHIR